MQRKKLKRSLRRCRTCTVLIIVSLMLIIPITVVCCSNADSLHYLETAEQEFLYAQSYKMSGEVLLNTYYQGEAESEIVYSEPFEMVSVSNNGTMNTSGYLDYGEIIEAAQESNAAFLETVDPKVPFFLVDGYMYKYQFPISYDFESTPGGERTWYKQKYYPAVAFAGYEEPMFLNGLHLVIGNEDETEVVEENDESIRFRLSLKDRFRDVILDEIKGLASEETLYEIEHAINNKSFEAYIVVSKNTGLVTSIEMAIKPFYIEQRTVHNPVYSDLTIIANISGYNEDFVVELPEEAKQAEEVEGIDKR